MQIEKRPDIKIKLTKTDFFVEFVCFIVLLGIWTLCALNYQSDNNYSFFITTSIATLLYIGISLLCKHPEKLNFPVNITHENAIVQYTIICKLARYSKLIVVVMFGMITINEIYNVNQVLFILFQTVLTISFFCVISFFISKSSKKK